MIRKKGETNGQNQMEKKINEQRKGGQD